MKKLAIALIAVGVASVAAAQTAPFGTQEKQKDVQSATQAGSGSSASTQKTAVQGAQDVKASKQQAKMTTAEKNAAIKAANQSGVNSNNDAGQAATAAQQKANVAESKTMPRQNAQFKTKNGHQQLEKELEQVASR